MTPRIVYHRAYNYGMWGTQWLHPFDQAKFARVWRRLRRTCGRQLQAARIAPPGPVDDATLLMVHTRTLLDSLRQPAVVARALEIPLVAWFPPAVIDRLILTPMRWQTAGTHVAARTALSGGGLAINLGGGFHHAQRELAHGFSIYNDIAVAIAALRAGGELASGDRVACIDLDAHHGDGVAAIFADDPRVFLLDMYNEANFPFDESTRRRVDCGVPLRCGCSGREYLDLLRRCLPGFLDALLPGGLKLAIYNAGTDVFEGDPIGRLQLSEQDILERDLFVLDQLHIRRIPAVMLLSGGYTRESYRLVARTVERLLCDATRGP